MKNLFQRISRRTLLPALAAGLAIGAIGLATPAAHAEPKAGSGSGTGDKHCMWSGADYSPGAVINVNAGTKLPPRYQRCNGDTGKWVDTKLVHGAQPVFTLPTGGVAVAP